MQLSRTPNYGADDLPILFANRAVAGQQLAEAVYQELHRVSSGSTLPRCIVYALPRGGLPIAAPIATRLNCPLDLVVAKKITELSNPELALGAVTAEGQVIWYDSMATIDPHSREQMVQRTLTKAKSLEVQLAPGRPQVDPHGAIALLVDDGIATGMTMAVAVEALRHKGVAQVWIAVPVAPEKMVSILNRWADRAIVLATPEPFYSVSRFYAEFPQVSVETALDILIQHRRMQHHLNASGG